MTKTTIAKDGQVAYDVDLQPVVLGQGTVPAFRDLSPGLTGDDVRQLQRLLAAAGDYSGAVDGRYGPAVTRAVRAWQRSLGATVTGSVPRGAVIYLPRLPATLAPADDLRVGAAAPVGTAAFTVLPPAPTFTITLPAGQAALTEQGMTVHLAYGDHQWTGKIASLGAPQDDGSIRARIGPTGKEVTVCGLTCSAVPPSGGTMPAEIQVVPNVTGVTVPAQAIGVGTDGRASLTRADGTLVPVTVRVTSGGVAVVDGLTEGTEIRVPTGE